MPVTKSFVEYIKTQPIVFEVFGHYQQHPLHKVSAIVRNIILLWCPLCVRMICYCYVGFYYACQLYPRNIWILRITNWCWKNCLKLVDVVFVIRMKSIQTGFSPWQRCKVSIRWLCILLSFAKREFNIRNFVYCSEVFANTSLFYLWMYISETNLFLVR